MNTTYCYKFGIGVVVGALFMSGHAAQASDDSDEGLRYKNAITSIPFETIPPNTRVTAGSITLDGSVEVNGTLSSDSTIEIKFGGLKFPDGTVQTTATSQSASANAGLYDNRIPNITPPLPYTEICFRDGSIWADIHAISEATEGGSCAPGDVGWVIERDERGSLSWAEARAECLKDNMRLPEIFEYQLGCMNDTLFGLSSMTDTFEWASNSAFAAYSGADAGIVAFTVGGGGCDFGSTHWVAHWNGGLIRTPYRCAR